MQVNHKQLPVLYQLLVNNLATLSHKLEENGTKVPYNKPTHPITHPPPGKTTRTSSNPRQIIRHSKQVNQQHHGYPTRAINISM